MNLQRLFLAVFLFLCAIVGVLLALAVRAPS